MYIGAQSFGNAHFGEGSGPVYFDDVNCLGTEKALGNCSRQRNCEHDEDASVKCLEGIQIIVNSSIIKILYLWYFT